MKRLTARVQLDICPLCEATVLTAGWDDLEAVAVDYIADPTPVDHDEQIGCVIAGRRLFYLEQTIARTFRLSAKNADNLDRALPNLVAVIPAHQCGARHPGVLHPDLAIALTGSPGRQIPDQPGWAAA